MRPALDAAPGARARLEAFIRANIAFIAAHPEHVRAVRQIAFNQVPVGGDDQDAASVLFAFAQGMVHPALIGHYSPEAVVAAVDYHLDRLRVTRS
ncbi:hypothetical protein ACIBI9_49980 [Nonomuraea sp. NPDC050451]|uniref:hypothetical protein n=1 Tax=Nonomuraea sp. NPDC050451 TaxID=3364364 RepID=UPI0037B66C56